MIAAIVFKLLAVAAIRGARRFLPTQEARVSVELGAAPWGAIGTDIAFTGTGVIAELFLLSTTAASAVYWPSSLVAHVVALMPALMLGSLTPWALRVFQLGPGTSRFARALLWSVLGASLVAALFIAWSIRHVVDRAQSAAQSAPYCILVAAPRSVLIPEHHPAASLLELSPLTMRGPCTNDACSAEHAILIMGHSDTTTTRQLVWSHRR
jgi:hypothetical protein